MNADASSVCQKGILAAAPLFAATLPACSEDAPPSEDGAMLSPVQTHAVGAAMVSPTTVPVVCMDGVPLTPEPEEGSTPPQAPDSTRVSFDEYLAWCEQTTSERDMEDLTYREYSAQLEEGIELFSMMNTPVEVANWHDTFRSYLTDIQKGIDDYPESNDDPADPEVLLGVLLPLVFEYQTGFNEAISAMDPEVRESLEAAGCIDDEFFGGGEESDIPLTLGESVEIMQDEPSRTDILSFETAALHELMPPSSRYRDVSYRTRRHEESEFVVSLALRCDAGGVPRRFIPFASSPVWNPHDVRAQYSLAGESMITQLQVVCMQRGHNIPTHGARYLSRPKAAEGPVQTCQRDCALNETYDVQGCIWKCEGE